MHSATPMGQAPARVPRLSWIAAACGAATLGLAALFPVWTNDAFGHMAAGRQIAELGHVPTHDTFSFYFDEPQEWRNHNWATGWLFHVLHALGGFDALVWLKVVLCAVLGGVLVASVRHRPHTAALCALVLLWVTPAVRARFTVRPHLFGLLCCALLLYGLVAISRRSPADCKDHNSYAQQRGYN